MTRVLVVDDEVALRLVVAEVLSDAGYDVETAGNGVEALASLQRTRPDVVLLDLVMPGMDGWSFLEIWRANPAAHGLPIGILSAAPEAAPDAAPGSIIRVIGKPFDLDELLAAVDELSAHSAVRYSVLHPEARSSDAAAQSAG
jgi:CheY-like chemotaxis protein